MKYIWDKNDCHTEQLWGTAASERCPTPALCRQDTPATIRTVWEGMDRHLTSVPRQGTKKYAPQKL